MLQMPVSFALVDDDADAISIQINNKRFFTDTSDLQLQWCLSVDGVCEASSADLAPTDGWLALPHDSVQPQVRVLPPHSLR